MRQVLLDFIMRDNLVSSLAITLIAFILGLGLTERVRRLFVKRAILDIPNDRSSHTIPVPRGGGWAIMAVLLPAALLPISLDGNFRLYLGFAGAILVLAAISWLDDKKPINPALRLGIHIFSAWLGSHSFTHDQTLFHGAIPFAADRALMILGWAWFINLYNFMDGIDGITSIETLSIIVGVSIVASAANLADPYINFISLVLTGLVLGFLAHNWHPAKIFLGDVGSIPLGYVTGFFLLTLAVKGCFAAAVILPLYYLADSGITITRRALQGQKIWQAHREHFYQFAAIQRGRHDKVALMILAANLGLIGAAILAVFAPWQAVAIAGLIVTLLLARMRKKT